MNTYLSAYPLNGGAKPNIPLRIKTIPNQTERSTTHYHCKRSLVLSPIWGMPKRIIAVHTNDHIDLAKLSLEFFCEFIHKRPSILVSILDALTSYVSCRTETRIGKASAFH